MAKEDYVKFYEEHVLKTPAIQAKLEGAGGRDEYVKVAIAEGSNVGLKFTADEVKSVMAATEQKLGSQLSDAQLDGVVGGAGTLSPTTGQTITVKQIPPIKPATVPGGTTVPQLPGGGAANTIGCCW